MLVEQIQGASGLLPSLLVFNLLAFSPQMSSCQYSLSFTATLKPQPVLVRSMCPTVLQ